MSPTFEAIIAISIFVVSFSLLTYISYSTLLNEVRIVRSKELRANATAIAEYIKSIIEANPNLLMNREEARSKIESCIKDIIRKRLIKSKTVSMTYVEISFPTTLSISDEGIVNSDPPNTKVIVFEVDSMSKEVRTKSQETTPFKLGLKPAILATFGSFKVYLGNKLPTPIHNLEDLLNSISNYQKVYILYMDKVVLSIKKIELSSLPSSDMRQILEQIRPPYLLVVFKNSDWYYYTYPDLDEPIKIFEPPEQYIETYTVETLAYVHSGLVLIRVIVWD